MSDNDDDIFQPILNPLPPAVWVLVLGMLSVELVIWAGTTGFVGGPRAVGWRLEAIRSFAVFEPLLAWISATGNWLSRESLRLVTYPFIHHGFGHMAMAAVFLLALGKLVGEVFGNFAVLAVFVGCSVFGALFWAAFSASPQPLIGAYPAAYGLIGAFTFILWADLGAQGRNRLAAFRLIGVLIAIRLIFGLFFGVDDAWMAEGAGFVLGFVMTPGLAPGGLARLRDRIRQR
jgi:membrane associated rhomboid family serine protease